MSGQFVECPQVHGIALGRAIQADQQHLALTLDRDAGFAGSIVCQQAGRLPAIAAESLVAGHPVAGEDRAAEEISPASTTAAQISANLCARPSP